jgi:hypothetical protein
VYGVEGESKMVRIVRVLLMIGVFLLLIATVSSAQDDNSLSKMGTLNTIAVDRAIEEALTNALDDNISKFVYVPKTFPKTNNIVAMILHDQRVLVLYDDNDTEVGRLSWETGELKFEGKIHESAKALLEVIKLLEQNWRREE